MRFFVSPKQEIDHAALARWRKQREWDNMLVQLNKDIDMQVARYTIFSRAC